MIHEEQISPPIEQLDAEDIEDVLIDALAIVEWAVGRPMPAYIRPQAMNTYEKLLRAVNWVTLH